MLAKLVMTTPTQNATRDANPVLQSPFSPPRDQAAPSTARANCFHLQVQATIFSATIPIATVPSDISFSGTRPNGMRSRAKGSSATSNKPQCYNLQSESDDTPNSQSDYFPSDSKS